MKRQMENVSPAAKVEIPTFTPPPVSTTVAQTSPANPSSSPTSSPTQQQLPTAALRFALSTDASDDSSTQMSVPIDKIVPFSPNNRKPVFSVIVISLSGRGESILDQLACQAFADAEARKPIAAGFRLEEERVFTGELVAVETVGCAMLGGGGFGGTWGLVGSGA